MTDFDTKKLEQELKTWSADVFAKMSADAKNNEYSTRTYLIQPFLARFIGADAQDSRQVVHEFKIPRRGGVIFADYVLKRDDNAWCVIEAKVLGSDQVTKQVHADPTSQGWGQLFDYANSTDLGGAAYFVLTDGRWWHWFASKDKHLSKEPFLSHDASAPPTAAALNWYSTILDDGSLEDLEGAVIEATFADTARSWLRALGSGDDDFLNNLLELKSAFAGLWGYKGGVVNHRGTALKHLKAVWPAVYGGFVRHIQDSADPEPGGSKSEELGRSTLDTGKAAPGQEIPASESYGKQACRWRIGKGSDWQIAKNGKILFTDVLQRLEDEFPGSPNAWYEAVWSRQPKWAGRSTHAAKMNYNEDLENGYSCYLPGSNPVKDSRLNDFIKLFAEVTGQTLHLELDWDYGSNQ